MNDQTREAMRLATELLGGEGVLVTPGQYRERTDTVEVPLWALAALAEHIRAAELYDFAVAAQDRKEHKHLLELLRELRPKTRNREDLYFEDYLGAIGGEYHDKPMGRDEALAFIAKKYNKTEGAMFQALKRELKFLRDKGEDIGAVLPRNPDTKSKSKS